jgi:hypothetical protein
VLGFVFLLLGHAARCSARVSHASPRQWHTRTRMPRRAHNSHASPRQWHTRTRMPRRAQKKMPIVFVCLFTCTRGWAKLDFLACLCTYDVYTQLEQASNGLCQNLCLRRLAGGVVVVRARLDAADGAVGIDWTAHVGDDLGKREAHRLAGDVSVRLSCVHASKNAKRCV